MMRSDAPPDRDRTAITIFSAFDEMFADVITYFRVKAIFAPQPAKIAKENNAQKISINAR
jgi:hypothetical protein